METLPSTIWAFDLGKGSIGEAVRQRNKFLHKASLLIPADLGRRGPATISGTPASKNRMLQTRRAHKRREEWLDTVWVAAGLTPLISRTVELVDFKIRRVKKNVRGKARFRNKKIGGRWILKNEADPKLEKEFGAQGDPVCYTSCLLRINLLNDVKLESWQLYKALFSAIQKRGYGKVPWEKERASDAGASKNAQEEAENAIAGKRWTDYSQHPEVAKLGGDYKLACYFDAWHMKLWSPLNPKHIDLQPKERSESTQKVVFPARIITEEVLLLASRAANQEDRLNGAFTKVMADWQNSVKKRIARVNAHRAHLGKALVRVPDFSLGAKNFAELLAFGPGGLPKTAKEGVRHIPSHDSAIRHSTGLRPGGPDDAMGVLNQEVARFDNRLRAPCALIPRLTVCRNFAPQELSKVKEDDDERLLPAQVTFLMKVKNMRVEERNSTRTQRGLKPEELLEIFNKLNPARKYHLTKCEWRTWCSEQQLLPVTDPDEKNAPKKAIVETESGEKKKSDDLAVDRPKVSGRGRFSRPTLRILKQLLLNSLSPQVFHTKLCAQDPELLKKLGMDVLTQAPTVIKDDGKGNKLTHYEKRDRPWVLVSDLDFLLRMGKDGKSADSWDDLYIPSQQLDRLAQEANASPEERKAAIRALIGKQNNPIVRHRLDTFWKRLVALEKKHGVPHRIVLEFVRDDSETSWLGSEASKKITEAQKEQRDRRENARKMLAEMGNSNGDVLKYLLWEAQGGQCLYGKPSGNPQCPYTETALNFTDLHKYRIDHIVPRAKGGPDSFSNKILTTDEANAAKGDRTPWRWFHQDRTLEDWDAYKSRVLLRARTLGWKKTRLLLDADAEKQVERYTPLAETAWIARLAQTIAGLHFGWANGNDREGKKRVTTVSGGLTGRTRRKYFLNSLLGRDRALDKKISDKLEALAELRSASLPREEQKAKARALRSELDDLNIEAEKQRDDDRHHALDAMVLSFLEGWVNDPNREEEFRFPLLGDNPTFPSAREKEIGQLRHQIIALGAAAEKANSSAERARLNQQVIACRDALASMRTERNLQAVREAFRREIDGDKESGIPPILPFWLHYPKPDLEATFHRGVWLRTESESRVARATVDDFATAMEQERVALADLPFAKNHVTEATDYSVAHGLRRATGIVPHKDYDSKAARICIKAFLTTRPTEAQWKEWCDSSAAPAGIKPKKGQPDKREFVFYRVEDKRTKRVSLFDLGVGSNEVPVFDVTHFELQVSRLVLRPERGTDKPEIPLQPDTELQSKLHALLPSIEAFYRNYPPDPGDRPRKESERGQWQQRKESSAKAWEEFIRETGLDRYKRVYLRTDAGSVTERRYEPARISSVLLVRVKQFDRDKAEKQTQFISDAWIRFQLREFLRRVPTPAEWKAFCATFVQVLRATLKEFLATQPQTAAEFIRFYEQQAEDSATLRGPTKKIRSLIRTVHKVIGNAHDYVDVSKDGSGIYAKGGNRGYFMWKRSELDGENNAKITYGAQPVRAFLKLRDVKRRLLNEKGVELIDKRFWQTNMLLFLTRDTQSGKKIVPSGYYFFGSVSNGTHAELKPLSGGDVYAGISIAALLAQGLGRVEL